MTTYWKQCISCKDNHRVCNGQYPCNICIHRGIECQRRVRETPKSEIKMLCNSCSKTAWYGFVNEKPTKCRDHRETNMIPIGYLLCEHEGCTSTSRAFGFPGQQGVRCKKHALPGMSNVQNPLCEHEGCTSTSKTYDNPGGKGRFCKDHALSTMINVRNPTCEHGGCNSKSRNFDIPGGKGRFCSLHKIDGMVDVRNAICIFEGCNKRPNFSFKGQPVRYCSIHKLSGMCNRNSCQFGECTIGANYNYPGEASGKFCASHKLDGMINVRQKFCNYPGCKTSASFGTASSIRCKAHAEEGMINLIQKLCEYDGCVISASYNYDGERARFCNSHKELGMICVIGKGCEFPGCQCKSRNYGIPGGKGRFCTTHKEPGMVDVVNPTCQECNTTACYGIPGSKKTHCTKHRKPGMISRPKAKCVVCRKPALYGKNYIPNHCELHKEEDDDNLMERECISCHLVMILDKYNKCEFCDPKRFESGRLAKQNALMTYLNNHGLKGNSTDIVIDNGICGKERPDRVFDFGDKIVILECDEHQHRDRQCLCEQTRMVNISQSYGGLPVYFIRWNPDNYSSTYLPVSLNNRHKRVCRYLTEIRDNKIQLPSAFLSVMYMYYDGWEETIEWNIITPLSSE